MKPAGIRPETDQEEMRVLGSDRDPARGSSGRSTRPAGHAGDDDGRIRSGAVAVFGLLRPGAVVSRGPYAIAVAFLAALAAAQGLRDHTPAYLAAAGGLALAARGIALGRPILQRHLATSVLLLVAAAAIDRTGHSAGTWFTLVAAGAVLVLPTGAPPPPSTSEREQVRALVARTRRDALAPFALRTDKSYLVAPDHEAAVAFRVRFGTAVVSGDPVGAPSSYPLAVDHFLEVARSRGWRIAVLGAGDSTVALWRERGLWALPIGREVVIDVDGFAMRGRSFRNLRQAVKRTWNAGVTTEIHTEQDLDPDLLAGLQAIVRAARGGHQNRGFSMILDHLLDGTHEHTLVAVARDASGRPVAFQRFATAAGGREISLDVPWRVKGCPNGVDERLAVDMVAWGAEHGARRVSLAFAAFPDLFAIHDRTALQTLAYHGVHLLDRLVRLESLYRFLRKFHAFGQQRYVALRPVEVLWAASAMLVLEFLPSRRRGPATGD